MLSVTLTTLAVCMAHRVWVFDFFFNLIRFNKTNARRRADTWRADAWRRADTWRRADAWRKADASRRTDAWRRVIMYTYGFERAAHRMAHTCYDHATFARAKGKSWSCAWWPATQGLTSRASKACQRSKLAPRVPKAKQRCSHARRLVVNKDWGLVKDHRGAVGGAAVLGFVEACKDEGRECGLIRGLAEVEQSRGEAKAQALRSDLKRRACGLVSPLCGCAYPWPHPPGQHVVGPTS